MSKKTINLKGDIVKGYLDKIMAQEGGRITIFKLTLAKKIYNENKAVFKNVEDVRGIIRYYLGASGDERRDSLKDRKYVEAYENPLGLPEEEKDADFTAEPFVLPSSSMNIGIMGDLHIPYHDNRAITAAISWLKDHRIDTILLNGDVIDCYKLSHFEKDPRRRNMKDEINAVILFFDILRDTFPEAKIFFRKANHEYRWDRYMKEKAFELFNIPDFNFDEVLRLRFFDITPIYHKRRIEAGKCHILHGDEYIGGGANIVSPARWISSKTKTNTITGHFHKVSEHPEKGLDENIYSVWTVGCLCDLHPFWFPYNNWGHGCARLRIHDNGEFDVVNLKIINGKVY